MPLVQGGEPCAMVREIWHRRGRVSRCLRKLGETLSDQLFATVNKMPDFIALNFVRFPLLDPSFAGGNQGTAHLWKTSIYSRSSLRNTSFKMNTYVPIKILCERTGLSEKTIRRLVQRECLPVHRLNPRGKILVDVEAFARYMESTKVAVQQDPLVLEVLKDLQDFMRR